MIDETAVRPELILGGPGGDDGQLPWHREGFPGVIAQAAPDIGARQGSRGQKRRVAQRFVTFSSTENVT